MATRRQRGVDEGAFSSPACYLHEFQHAPVSTPAHVIDRLWPRGISRQRAAAQHGTAHLAQ